MNFYALEKVLLPQGMKNPRFSDRGFICLCVVLVCLHQHGMVVLHGLKNVHLPQNAVWDEMPFIVAVLSKSQLIKVVPWNTKKTSIFATIFLTPFMRQQDWCAWPQWCVQ